MSSRVTGKKRAAPPTESSSESHDDQEEPSSKRRKLNNGMATSNHVDKIRRRIQFYEKQADDTNKDPKLLFQFKHSFPSTFTFSDLLTDIAPKLGKKKPQLADATFLLSCLENGKIALFSHDESPSSPSSPATPLASKWDEILDLDEQVIEIVLEDNEVLALCQTVSKLDDSSARPNASANASKPSKNVSDPAQTPSGASAVSAASGDVAGAAARADGKKSDADEAGAVRTQKRQKRRNLKKFAFDMGRSDGAIARGQTRSVKVRFWDEMRQFEELRVDVPVDASVDELKQQLARMVGVGHRWHSSDVLASLRKEWERKMETKKDGIKRLCKQSCMCMDMLAKFRKLPKFFKNSGNVGLEGKEVETKDTIVFYQYETVSQATQASQASQASSQVSGANGKEESVKKLVGTEIKGINFETTLIKDLCDRIEKECNVSFRDTVLFVKPSRAHSYRQRVGMNSLLSLAKLGFKNPSDASSDASDASANSADGSKDASEVEAKNRDIINAFYCCSAAAHGVESVANVNVSICELDATQVDIGNVCDRPLCVTDDLFASDASKDASRDDAESADIDMKGDDNADDSKTSKNAKNAGKMGSDAKDDDLGIFAHPRLKFYKNVEIAPSHITQTHEGVFTASQTLLDVKKRLREMMVTARIAAASGSNASSSASSASGASGDAGASTSVGNDVKLSDLRLYYRLGNNGGLMSLDDETKLCEFGSDVSELRLWACNVAKQQGGVVDTCLDLFSHCIKLGDRDPFESVGSLLRAAQSDALGQTQEAQETQKAQDDVEMNENNLNNSKNENDEVLIYMNQRWLYHSNASKIMSNRSGPDGTNLRFEHAWNPAVIQTNRGMAALLSVLKLLQYEKDQVKNGLLGRMFTLFCGFPCFLLSLRIALFAKHAAQLDASHRALLSNGMYHLARQIAPKDDVPDNRVFEALHAIVSHLLQYVVTDHISKGRVHFNTLDLTCPLSLERLVSPVRIVQEDGSLSKEIYSNASVAKDPKLKNKKKIFDTGIERLMQTYPNCDEVTYFDFNKINDDQQRMILEYFYVLPSHGKSAAAAAVTRRRNGSKSSKTSNKSNKSSKESNTDSEDDVDVGTKGSSASKASKTSKMEINDLDEDLDELLSDADNEEDADQDDDMKIDDAPEAREAQDTLGAEREIIGKLFSLPFDELCDMAGLGSKNGVMKVVPTLSILSLSNSKSRVLTVDVDGNLCVCQGILENFHNVDSAGGSEQVFNNNRTFFRPLYNDKVKDTFDLHNLADRVSTVWPSLYKASNMAGDVIDDRTPTEAIFVCFDRSGSMDLMFEKTGPARERNTFYIEKNDSFDICLHLQGSEGRRRWKVARQPDHGHVTITSDVNLHFEPEKDWTGEERFAVSYRDVRNNSMGNDDDDDNPMNIFAMLMNSIEIKVKVCEEITEDIKKNMENNKGKNDITRLKAATIFFNAFINRSAAYDYANHIGLIVFNNDVAMQCALSPLYEKFARRCDQIRASGETKLLDSINLAIKKLLDWKNGDIDASGGETPAAAKKRAKRKNAKLRIITLTDGVDNGSNISTFALTRKLVTNEIVVDSVCIGDSASENEELRAICKASGGYVFIPETFRDGLRIFECETFITQVLRPEYNQTRLDGGSLTLQKLESLKEAEPDECSDVKVPKSKQNEKMTEASQSLESQMNLFYNNKKLVSGMKKNLRLKRIMREMKSLLKNKHEYWDVYVNNDDYTFWKLVLVGPESTCYEGGTWLLYLDFGKEYPMKAPKMRFDQSTPIKHVNVNGHGRICHSVFGRDYSPDTSVRDILNHVYGLLLHPDWDDPLDSVLRQQYADNRDKFEESVRQHVEKFAMSKSREDYAKELGEE